ncbi:MAG: GNAT family N-acetyltransferase [Actinomycetota bacterium]|nr:GNAT family N-acetyltransferase [Actinomycetota bacterium]
MKSSTVIRWQPIPEDRAHLPHILLSSGMFYDFEVDVALELLEDALLKGDKSEYMFAFADMEGKPLGYICYGPITMTQGRWDLYWIAVHQDARRKGIGMALLAAAGQKMKELGGQYLYSETSSRELYKPTRDFYVKAGFIKAATVPEYYAAGDHKVIYMKKLD